MPKQPRKHFIKKSGRRIFVSPASGFVSSNLTGAGIIPQLNLLNQNVPVSDSTLGTTPVFASHGSRLDQPDIQIVFAGPFWPGPATSAINQNDLMDSFTSIVTGPYLNGLTQYGFTGPVNMRAPMRISQLPALGSPPTGGGITNGVFDILTSLLSDDAIPNVDDNHELFVLFVLDPSILMPADMARGAHTFVQQFNFLDDDTRFEYGWILTSPDGAESQPDQATADFSHELVETISDPEESGWRQVVPPPSFGKTEIADCCKVSGRLNGVMVSSYWSVADQKCVIPTGDHHLHLIEEPGAQVPHDGPKQTAFHSFGPLCNQGIYSYVERTYENETTIKPILTSYNEPSVTWMVDGSVIGDGTTSLPLPATFQEAGAGGLAGPLHPEPRPTTAEVQFTNLSGRAGHKRSGLVINAGPNVGNTSFTVTATAVESFDSDNATQRVASWYVVLHNQEIVWDSDYQRDAKACRRIHGLSAGPAGSAGQVPNPGDPWPDVISEKVLEALMTRGSQRSTALQDAAKSIKQANPALAEALEFLAYH